MNSVETSLFFCNSRYYDPEIGRWISADDISYLDPESIGGLNLYAYCNNNPIMYCDPSGCFAISTFLISMAVTWAITSIATHYLGAHTVGGVTSMLNGGGAIGTGIALCAFGPIGIALGIGLMVVGGATMLMGANELAYGITGTNYLQSWTGMSDNLYNGLYTGLNIASAVGTIAGNIGMKFASNRILNNILNDPSKINNYSAWQIKTYGRFSSNWSLSKLTQSGDGPKGYKIINGKDGLISFSPRSGHHGNVPYFKVSSGANGTKRYDYYLREILESIIWLL